MLKFTNGRDVTELLPTLYQKATLTEVQRYNTLLQKFKQYFGGSAYLCSSPGRVEIIGNHTDHNGGKVIGATINSDIVAAFLPCENRVVMKSSFYRDINFATDNLEKDRGSIGLVKGVMKYLQKQGYAVGGFVACLSSQLPSGYGISSSAAFQMLVAEIQNVLYNNGTVPKDVLARAGQFAENKYFDKPCGLLDQSVIVNGGVVALDFSHGVTVTHLADSLDQTLFVVNTGSSHSKLVQHYSAIPNEMKDVASFFGATRLVDVSSDLFFAKYNQLVTLFGERPVLRAKHFYEENARVDEMCFALADGDVQKFNQLINLSGESSRYQLQNYTYEGGSTALCDAVDFVKSICPNGASRVHGGGFAGTVLCAIPDCEAEKVCKQLAEKYGAENVKQLKVRKYGVTVL